MTDQDLISKLKKEESRNYGFNLLIRTYQERVYWHIRKMVIDHSDADDLTQEVFIKVWKSIDKFREDASLYTWIYRIATNECLNFLKKKRRKFLLPIHDVESELTEKIDDGQLISGEEIEMKLQRELLKLPDKQRMVFNMKYFDEMKFDQISEITGTSVGALKASYHHAVKKIENNLRAD